MLEHNFPLQKRPNIDRKEHGQSFWVAVGRELAAFADFFGIDGLDACLDYLQYSRLHNYRNFSPLSCPMTLALP